MGIVQSSRPHVMDKVEKSIYELYSRPPAEQLCGTKIESTHGMDDDTPADMRRRPDGVRL